MPRVTWKIQLDLSEALAARVRRYLTDEGRSRVELKWNPEGDPVEATVLDLGSRPELPLVPIARGPEGPVRATAPWQLGWAPHYRVLIDDTGSSWSGEAPDGRFVALCCPVEAPLPEAPLRLHATQDPDAALRLLSALLQLPVAVLGLRAAELPNLEVAERWQSALCELLRRLLLLLPAAPKGVLTALTVVVEEHAGVKAGDRTEALVEAVLMALHRDLGPDCPRFALQIVILEKGVHAPLCLADALAWAWTAGAPSAQGRSPTPRAAEAIAPLVAAGLLPPPGRGPHDRIDAAVCPGRFELGAWRALLGEAQAGGPDGLAAHLLGRLESWVARDPEALQDAVRANHALLYSREFSVAQLQAEAASLGRMGAGATESPALRLGVAAAQLADRNRRGALPDADLIQGGLRLAAKLEHELPAEAAELRLRASVSFVNALDWAGAHAALPADDVPLPLAQRGRVKSARGQIFAIEGDLVAAAACFEAALADLARLTGPGRGADLAQTRAYALHAAWGKAPSLSAKAARLQIGAARDVSPAALRRLFVAAEPHRAWALLDVLRWMVRYPEDTVVEADLLLDCAEGWAEEQGHPWPLIGLYRALAVRAEAEPADLADSLDVWAEQAQMLNAGPAMSLIALSIELHRLAFAGLRHSPRASALEAELRRTLPRAAPRIEAGFAWVEAGRPIDGVGLLEATLPFSFR